MHVPRVRYGTHRGQVADLRVPRNATGPQPAVVVIHGGSWRARRGKIITAPFAKALTAEGFVTWNIEYRRVGRGGGGGGFPETLEDVATAIDALAAIDDVEIGPVITCGHSAGGHLALWAAARPRLGPGAPGGTPVIRIAGAISLCGVADLEEAYATGGKDGAVGRFLGDGPGLDARLELASPARHLPLGVPQVLFHGLDDTSVSPEMSERYVARAKALGDDATYVPLPGVAHTGVIGTRHGSFPLIVDAVRSLTATETVGG